MPITNYIDSSFLCCGSLKYGSLAIHIIFLVLGTWGTNYFVGVNVREQMLIMNYRTNKSRTPMLKNTTSHQRRQAEELNYSIHFDSVDAIGPNCTGPACDKSDAEAFPPLEDEGLNEISLKTAFQNVSPGTSNHQNETDNQLESTDQPDDSPVGKVKSLPQNKTGKLQTNEGLKSAVHGSFAAGAIFAILWTASIYGLAGFATGVKELLIAPIVMYALASILTVGLVFIDMGVFDVSKLFGGIFYFLMLIGAVVKIGVAIILLYCFFVVFSYYKELRDNDATPAGTPTD